LRQRLSSSESCGPNQAGDETDNLDSYFYIQTLAFGGLAREVLDAQTTNTLRLAGLAREVLISGRTGVAFGAVAREALVGGRTDISVAGLVREALDAAPGVLHVGGLVREALLPGRTTLLVGGLVREVLIRTTGTSALFDVVLREALLAGTAPPPETKLRPYILINV
jgi:hypothetical protein